MKCAVEISQEYGRTINELNKIDKARSTRVSCTYPDNKLTFMDYESRVMISPFSTYKTVLTLLLTEFWIST